MQVIEQIDDISLEVEAFKDGLVARATGELEFISDNEYKKYRKLFLTNPLTRDIMPDFVRSCRSLSEFWGFIKLKFGSYQERREYLANIFNPIIEKFENQEHFKSLNFDNNYEEKSLIGQGGFSQVYLFEHKLLRMPFAIKVFAPAFYDGNEVDLQRFFQEARILFDLNHPNIIRVYDIGLINNQPFIRMEYFDGMNLNQVLIKHGSINLDKSILLMKNLIKGMIHAHEDIGVIHRDLKPSNIMVSAPNKFKIIDFGLGIYIENQLYSRLTQVGERAVSGYYTAPELIANPKLIDKRSDIYSLGAIWFTLLTGQPPAGTNIIQQLQSISGVNLASIKKPQIA